MPLSNVGREYNEGRYGEWDYGLKPLIAPVGGGNNKPLPINLTIARDIPVLARGPLIIAPTRIPEYMPMQPPGIIDPNRHIPKVYA